MAEQWLSIVEYARTFNVSDMTVRRRIRTGRIKAELKEGKYFIPVSRNEIANSISEVEEPSAPSIRERGSSFYRPKVESHHLPVTRPQVSQERVPGNFRMEEESRDVQVHSRQREFSRPQGEPERSSAELTHNKFGRSDEIISKVGDIDLSVQNLTEACRKGFEKITAMEAQLEARYRSDIVALESRLKNKDLELDKQSQKIEDLQLLISILEKRNS